MLLAFLSVLDTVLGSLDGARTRPRPRLRDDHYANGTRL